MKQFMYHRIKNKSMAFSTVIIFFCILSGFQCNGSDERTTVLEKVPRVNATPCLGPYDFEELFVESSAIVDKSLLIKKLWDADSKVALITYPKGWGKTMNLDMLKTFLNTEVRKNGSVVPREESVNYNLFMKGELAGYEQGKVNKPFLISQHGDFCDKHLGRYATISLSLKGFKAFSFDEMLNDMKDLISEAFGKHDYLIGVYEAVVNSPSSTSEEKKAAEEKLDRYEKYVDADFNANELRDSLVILSEILYDHFKKPSIVYIDDFDRPMRLILDTLRITTADQNKFIDFYSAFFARTFNATHVKRGFITGTLKLATDRYLSPLEGFVDYHFANNELGDFYGFKYHEVESLLKHFNVSANERNKTHDYYNGYGASSDLTQRSYTTVSIASYLFFKRRIARYFIDVKEANHYLDRFFALSVIRRVVKEMVDGLDVEIHRVALQDLTINKEDFDNLRQFLTLERHIDHVYITSPAFKFLFAYGYLSFKNEASSDEDMVFKVDPGKIKVSAPVISDEKVILKFPNKEAMLDMNMRLSSVLMCKAMREEDQKKRY